MLNRIFAILFVLCIFSATGCDKGEKTIDQEIKEVFEGKSVEVKKKMKEVLHQTFSISSSSPPAKTEAVASPSSSLEKELKELKDAIKDERRKLELEKEIRGSLKAREDVLEEREREFAKRKRQLEAGDLAIQAERIKELEEKLRKLEIENAGLKGALDALKKKMEFPPPLPDLGKESLMVAQPSPLSSILGKRTKTALAIKNVLVADMNDQRLGAPGLLTRQEKRMVAYAELWEYQEYLGECQKWGRMPTRPEPQVPSYLVDPYLVKR